MTIVKHVWNGVEISQASESFAIGKQEVPAGAVNLTDICKAHGKDVFQFMRLPSTQDFCKAYEGQTAKTAVCSIRGGSNPGTWAALPLAIKCCGWISPEFEVWGMTTLAKIVTGQEIENSDRAEGWARLESMGSMPVSPFDEFFKSFGIQDKPAPQLIKPDINDPFSTVDWALAKSKESNIAPDEVLRLINIAAGKESPSPAPSPKTAKKQASPKPAQQPIEQAPQSSVAQFVEDCVEFDDSVIRLEKQDVYSDYQAYCEANNLQATGFNSFCSRMKALLGADYETPRSSTWKSGKTVNQPAAFRKFRIK